MQYEPLISNLGSINSFRLSVSVSHSHLSTIPRLPQLDSNDIPENAHHRRCDQHNGTTTTHPAILRPRRHPLLRRLPGFARFVNIRDGGGATPLYLAARQGQSKCVHVLLDNGALVCASTVGYGYPGSTPLYLAAHGGSLDCVKKLLAWGADRLPKDSSG
ncbi:E3 ubiquitin-protein ligase XBAT31 [Pyrus ussuriensis x Pyrus communis]|uniref:E3 ubiquitin-protein ligase XBAT31 n=1 Tax=Pyrus ussuriensis x Pyrus communis TaxID=2448454 RepID=A0A5N5H2A9_9ROSA|nr:E3 ubiquitin-protein ligase XBAT31 [Pyrus ussuriensis x Pyrus communis]